ncbi:hypothetical protein G7Z17_g7236 [Cylindrodendrum hubeiense]|uniref:Cytochrome P450 n=1 Tax=Cylindrodendrum hubeiense TaxID=595255 RepID=A0A9P5HBT3_9HYPO|nr:hypothetical protein G7Z17_g7236 [Cylindrodendrum hubeiense]
MNPILWVPVVVLYAAISCQQHAVSLASFLGYAIAVFAGSLGLRLLWTGFLWPNYLSPLRHLPTVPDAGVFSKETLRIYTEPRGAPQCEWINKLGHVPQGVVRYRSILGTERLLVVSPDALAEVLVSKSYDFRKPAFVVTELRQVLGMGVLLAEGDHHKVQREGLQPAFAFRHVKDMYGMMWSVAVHLITTMTSEFSAMPQESPVAATAPDDRHSVARDRTITTDISDWASRATLDIIGIGGMGQDFDAIAKPGGTLHQTYQQVFQPSREAIFLAVLRLALPDWLVNWLPFKRNRQVRRSAQTIRSLCRQMIHEARAQRRRGEAGGDVFSSGKNILSVALSSGTFTDESLIDQMMTFLAAGHETTATALAWAIYIMCVHPEMQEKLRREVRACLPSPSLSPSLSDSTSKSLASSIDTRMPYLKAVCLEVLRYFPPVPATFREAIRPTSILQTPVPAGTTIVLAPRVTNRDSTLWGADAHVFNPDRWLPTRNQEMTGRSDSSHGMGAETAREDGAEHRVPDKEARPRSNFATMTFLHGPRSCIGQSFARAELAILLATLVGRFEFHLADESLSDEKNIKISRGATSRPNKGLLVKAKLVDGW